MSDRIVAAAVAVGTIFGDHGGLLGTLGPNLTCAETNALVELLQATGHDTAADALLAQHVESDEEGDAHWKGDTS